MYSVSWFIIALIRQTQPTFTRHGGQGHHKSRKIVFKPPHSQRSIENVRIDNTEEKNTLIQENKYIIYKYK